MRPFSWLWTKRDFFFFNKVFFIFSTLHWSCYLFICRLVTLQECTLKIQSLILHRGLWEGSKRINYEPSKCPRGAFSSLCSPTRPWWWGSGGAARAHRQWMVLKCTLVISLIVLFSWDLKKRGKNIKANSCNNLCINSSNHSIIRVFPYGGVKQWDNKLHLLSALCSVT